MPFLSVQYSRDVEAGSSREWLHVVRAHAKSAFISLAAGGRASSRWAWLALMLALVTPLGAEVMGQGAIPRNGMGHVMKEEPKETQRGTLRTSDRIRDLLNHPQLAGYAHLMLPWDDRPYDPDTRLNDIGPMLPYHTHVAPKVVVSALNRIIDDAGNGNTVFFDFYSDEQKRADRSKARTGLFFFRGKPGAPFAIIAPGRRILLCRLNSRRVSPRGGDQQRGTKRLRP
jgi:hypothetical protein